jgi:hypothetical protein
MTDPWKIPFPEKKKTAGETCLIFFGESGGNGMLDGTNAFNTMRFYP